MRQTKNNISGEKGYRQCCTVEVVVFLKTDKKRMRQRDTDKKRQRDREKKRQRDREKKRMRDRDKKRMRDVKLRLKENES